MLLTLAELSFTRTYGKKVKEHYFSFIQPKILIKVVEYRSQTCPDLERFHKTPLEKQ